MIEKILLNSTANICYVCLEKKNEPISNINSSLSVNKDIIHIIGYLPFDLAWLKSKQIILICEKCCLRLRETDQFRAMCLKNSALLQSYTDNLNTSTASNTENEAELTVALNLNNKYKNINEIKLEDGKMYTDECGPITEETKNVFVNFEDSFVKEEDTWKREEAGDEEKHPMDNNSIDNKSNSEIFVNTTVNEAEVTGTLDLSNRQENINEIKCEIKLEDEEMYTNECRPIIEETDDIHVKFEQHFIKEEDTWEREEADDKEEYPTDNNSTTSTDNESDSEISVNSNAHITDADSISSGFTCKQVHATNKEESTIKSYTCSICTKSFTSKCGLKRHVRLHTAKKRYKCIRCEKRFLHRTDLRRHIRIHTGEKPYKCSSCEKCFNRKYYLIVHTRVHTGEKPYKCSTCEKCFGQRSNLNSHMLIHVKNVSQQT